MKLGKLALQPLGEVAGCLLLELLESAPGATGGLRVPASRPRRQDAAPFF